MCLLSVSSFFQVVVVVADPNHTFDLDLALAEGAQACAYFNSFCGCGSVLCFSFYVLPLYVSSLWLRGNFYLCSQSPFSHPDVSFPLLFIT